MSLPVILRPDAQEDVRATHDDQERSQAGLGRQFIGRLREALERIEAMPELYAPIWRDVRTARLKRYRHLVYYIVLPARVEVLAVMHGSRDASEWQSRV